MTGWGARAPGAPPHHRRHRRRRRRDAATQSVRARRLCGVSCVACRQPCRHRRRCRPPVKLSGRTSTTAGAGSHRKQRSRSSSRYVDKPKKKKQTASVSLVSIPNTIKLSMLNSGLISFV
ncbi:uncharacterized protein LOC124355833 [Homalodisca vitripennis]|uniref:uncharacterized protein LOC124355833 n=1 Tax=Homalodisca vitripennis TaxID=197043 RepID=UPI001EEB404C|nr:uncharacterized protein LOC124355833 [Homalodisca vitripennis]